MRKFVVTGCGHSGTSYTAQLLRSCGLSCGHESLFRSWWDPPTSFAGWDGDSSWLAAPHLSRLPEEVVVFHQIRDPRYVIASYLAAGHFARFRVEGSVPLHIAKRMLRRKATGVYANREFVREHAREVFAESGQLARAARYWLSWNRLVERQEGARTYLRYSVANLDADLLGRMFDLIGAPYRDRINAALSSVRRDANTKPRATRCIDIGELPEPLSREIAAQSDRYGIDCP